MYISSILHRTGSSSWVTYDMSHMITYATHHILVIITDLITCPYYTITPSYHTILHITYDTILVVTVPMTDTITAYATHIAFITLFLSVILTIIMGYASPCTIMSHHVSSYLFASCLVIIHMTDIIIVFTTLMISIAILLVPSIFNTIVLVAYTAIIVVAIMDTTTVHATGIISVTLFFLVILVTIMMTGHASPCTSIHHHLPPYVFALSSHIIVSYHRMIHVTDTIIVFDTHIISIAL